MNLLIFFIALSILVLVHELGHFVAARRNGVKVEEFGLGLPPKVWGKKIGETIYSLNALPIGGFCKLLGEDPPTASQSGGRVKLKNNKRSFYFKKPWQKIVILAGGVTMNLVLAVGIFTAVYYVTGVPEEIGKVLVEKVVEGSPADEAGIKENDFIVAVDGQEIDDTKVLIEKVDKYKGELVELEIERSSGEREKVVVEVRESPPEGEGSMGVVITSIKIVKLAWWQGYKGISQGFREAYFWGKTIVGGLVDMIAGVFKGQIPKDVAGPVGMYQVTAMVREESGFLGVLQFFGVVSVNLAVVNLLPLPALDGGRIMFVLWEKISGKKINAKFEATANAVGMSLLLGLLLLVTVGDVMRIIFPK